MSDFGWPEERGGLLRASSRWWLFLLLGIAAAALGLLLGVDRFTAVRTVALLVAFGLMVTGLGELVSAGRYRSTLGIAAGIVLLLAGVLAALWPDITLWVLAVVTGIALIVSGAARIMGALALRVEGWGWSPRSPSPSPSTTSGARCRSSGAGRARSRKPSPARPGTMATAQKLLTTAVKTFAMVWGSEAS